MRKDGRPKHARNIVLEDRQYEILTILGEQIAIVKVSISSMVRKAVQDFIDSQLANNPSLREKIEQSVREKVEGRAQRGKVVSIAGAKTRADEKGQQ